MDSTLRISKFKKQHYITYNRIPLKLTEFTVYITFNIADENLRDFKLQSRRFTVVVKNLQV